ncbi:hypothetical protein DSL72_000816 [Monilinia vaccinii-corymbosi]|uniref:2EXR domain-containing protein n=1 Tax=Monilinia vaccinii-corymbosi TaxID=61207 RepID=A0A8A3P0D9_9HELO|nr:hypothetical protein DSL72_000816 [Monilinia vaccinii-corymbosi]
MSNNNSSPSSRPVFTTGRWPWRVGGLHRGVNVQGESPSEITNRLAGLELEKANKPLTDFMPFCSLAPEIRFKVWNFAARAETRILELVRHPHYAYSLDHRIFQVSRPGQKVPGIMQANRESRREGMLVFEKRYINVHTIFQYMNNDERPWTWYNPHNDIIFFGKDTCIRTIVNFYDVKSNENYAKVAFRCADVIGTCKARCDFDPSKFPNNDKRSLCSWGAAIGGAGVGILGVLHGKDEEIAMNDMVPGAPGVKEVFFVVETECMQFEAGAMPSNLTFRPPIHNGLTNGQEREKTYLQAAIRQVRSGNGVVNCGENRWNTDNYPDFNFVSLAPPLKVRSGKVLKHDSIMVPAKHASELIYPGSKFLYDLGQKTGVDIIHCEMIYQGLKEREIGLFNGTEEGIEKAKGEIKKQLLADFNYHQGAERDADRDAEHGAESRRAERRDKRSFVC